MDVPEIELYAVERIVEEPAGGIRIYRSDDAVFEARSGEDADTRIYRDGDRWYTKIRFDEDDVEDAYNEMMRAADDINERYGTALDIAPPEFLVRAEEDGEIHIEDGRIQLNYVEETELDEAVDELFDEPARSSILKGAAASGAAEVGAGSVLGAAVGAVLGAAGGPPGVIGGAGMGAAAGGTGGGVLAALDSAAAAVSLPRPSRLNMDSRLPMTNAVKWFEERRKEKYTALDAMEDHLSTLNKLHSMEEEVDVIREMDLERHEELEDLQDSDIEQIHDVLMEVHFDRFEESEGVTVVHEAGSYEEAAEFASVVTPEADGAQERPSIYTAPEAFRTIFERCTYTERDTLKYFDDAGVLVENVYGREAVPQEIVGWLERQHRDLIQDVGRERSMTTRENRRENRYGSGPDTDER